VSADPEPLKKYARTLDLPSTKSRQQEANEGKDVIPIFLYARENSLDGDYNYK